LNGDGLVKALTITVTVFMFINAASALIKDDLPTFWRILGFAGLVFLGIQIKYVLNSRKIFDKLKKKIFSSLIQQEYLAWQQEIFEKLYTNVEYSTLYGRKYPALIIRDSKNHKYPYDELCELKECDLPQIQLNKTQKKFLKILGTKLRYPKMKGFALKKLVINDQGFLERIEAITTNYKQNLATCHILEWELYKYYQKSKKIPDTPILILENLPYRKKYHANREGFKAILEPKNAYPLLSVQAIIIYKDYSSDTIPNWKVILKKRNDKVAIKPGFLQFPPAGGFEVYGTEDDEDDFLLKKGFDVRSAIFREYSEEIFDNEEMQIKPDSRESDYIYKEDNVKELMQSIKEGKSYLDFMGIIVDLSVLRHEISFLLLIDDAEFSKKTIYGNWEAQDIMSVRLSELKDYCNTGKMHSSSAALLQLASENKRLKELGITKEFGS